MQKLKIHENGRFLQYEDGTPFFYLGDTAWDLFHRITGDEVEYYMSVRASQGFNVIQCVLLTDFPNRYGRYALRDNDFSKFDYDTDGKESYWAGVDACLDVAEKYGIYLAIIPMWNSSYDNPETTIFKGYEPSYEFGKFIGDRYKDRNNIIWLLGGDVFVKPHMHPIFDGLAAGIKDGEREDNHRLMSFHPHGISDTITELGGDKDYLDFLTSQSGHTVNSYDACKFFEPMIPSGKPFLDSEPHYEDHVANWIAEFRKWDASDIREGAYESVLAGACGQGYGNPIIAFFLYEPISKYKCPYYVGNVKKDNMPENGWHDAIRHEGAEQLKYLKQLRLSRPYFDLRPAPEMVLNSEDDFLFGRIMAARGDDYAFIYTPHGREIEVDATCLDKQFVRASWFNPRTGEEREICMMTSRKALFVPETCGKGQDWLLILDGGKRDWKEIGQMVH